MLAILTSPNSADVLFALLSCFLAIHRVVIFFLLTRGVLVQFPFPLTLGCDVLLHVLSILQCLDNGLLSFCLKLLDILFGGIGLSRRETVVNTANSVVGKAKVLLIEACWVLRETDEQLEAARARLRQSNLLEGAFLLVEL